jgi:hypothetical protein
MWVPCAQCHFWIAIIEMLPKQKLAGIVIPYLSPFYSKILAIQYNNAIGDALGAVFE